MLLMSMLMRQLPPNKPTHARQLAQEALSSSNTLHSVLLAATGKAALHRNRKVLSNAQPSTALAVGGFSLCATAGQNSILVGF